MLARADRRRAGGRRRDGAGRPGPRRRPEIASAVQDRLPFTDVIVVCGAVGGKAGAEVHAALVRVRRARHHPGRDASRLDAGVRPARAGRRPDLPVPVLPGDRAAAVRGAGAPADPARARAGPTRTAGRSPPGSPRRSPRSPGRRGYLRGRLLREQATGDYLVQPLGTAGTHLLSSLIDCERADRAARGAHRGHRRRAGVAVAVPARAQPDPSDGARVPSAPRRPASGLARGPGRAARAGRPGRAAAGAAARRRRWSEIRIRDERHLAPWEPTMPGAGRSGTRRRVAGPVVQLRAAARRGAVAAVRDDRSTAARRAT